MIIIDSSKEKKFIVYFMNTNIHISNSDEVLESKVM